jgi:two-component system chemotaxis sensor kinase CheA
MSGASEFVSEAQEVIETFSRKLLEIEQLVRKREEIDPDLLNASFRAVHTLKGLASLGGDTQMVKLSHELETCLDAIRLGKRELDQGGLDVLFEAVEVFGRLLASAAHAEDGEDAEDVDIEPLLLRIEGLGSDQPAERDESLAGIDESVLGVLTEYEEHRLKENLRMGRRIYKVHAAFDLLAIDVGIEALKDKMKAYGEVITYLPSADSSADDRIELDILLGSKASIPEISAGIGDSAITVTELAGAGGEPEPVSSAGMVVEPEPEEPAPAAAEPEVPAAPPAASDASEAEVDHALDVEHDVSLRSLSQTVRVDLRRLDSLMNLVGELGLVEANVTDIVAELRLRHGMTDPVRGLHDQLRNMSRKLALLQQGILEVRMVPLGQVFDKLARVVRKLSREAGKDVRLDISGAETELDKLIVEELSDPLMHMMRNAIDHGIEPANERVALGKQASGHIDLRAFQKGNRVVIEVQDDGRGMDWRKIRDTAISRGFVAREEASDLSPRQALNLIFSPGFSTRSKASELSGRGVGMDVVKTNISRLSGMIDVATQPGRGSRFAITLPVTLAIIQALVIETAGQTFCVPLNSVLESIMVQSDEVTTVEGHEVVTLRGKTLPLLYLARIFDLAPDDEIGVSDRSYVVVVGLAQHRVGIVVDELLGQQDVVIKPLGAALRQVPGIAGATELGANRTVLLLDVATLVAEAVGSAEGTLGEMGDHGG